MDGYLRAALIGAITGLVLAQTTSAPPAFEAGDVRSSPRGANASMRGGYYPAGNRYELHQATMADLIRTAWSLDDNNRVVSGPAWLDDIRFDVLAKAPDSTSREAARLMLRTLLEDRAGLAVHEEKRPLPAYVLTAGARPLLRQAAGDGGQCDKQPQTADPDGIPLQAISCHGVTMEAFARALPEVASEYFGHIPMVDQTALKGLWDFSLRWNSRGQLGAGGNAVSLFSAIEKQLGLRLEQKEAPLPVVVVDRVNAKPVESTPETIQKLPRSPSEFEVAEIKPSPADEKSSERVLPGGGLDLRGTPMKELVLFAWDIGGVEATNEELLVAPKWIDTVRFDVIAKAMSGKAGEAPPLDEGVLRVMMRNLLVGRFKMTAHYETRPVTVYSLAAAKPKMTKADPATRTGCKFTALAAGSKSPLTRNFVCRNVSMERFAEKLRDLATDWVDRPVVDATGLEGGWDFTLSFSPRAAMAIDGKAGADTADPDGRLGLFDALNRELGLKVETKKAPTQVLVIDRMEQQPTEN